MDRRAFLTSAAGAGILGAAGFPTPAISQRAGAGVVRLVPHADLANFDPIWTPAYIARNAGMLVWDTLYGVDSKLKCSARWSKPRCKRCGCGALGTYQVPASHLGRTGP